MTTTLRHQDSFEVDKPSTLLSGAEVVAAILVQNNVEIAFGYPGTSELAMCDALVRSTIAFDNARGDKEAAFLAAGASLLRPNRGCAVLHGARGVTNALGGIAAANRSEIGTTLILGLPSSSSAKFLPPHGEFELVKRIGSFTKWANEVPGPADSADPYARGRKLVDIIRMALVQAANPPHGPTLVGIPQDVLESRSIPEEVLDHRDTFGRVRTLEEQSDLYDTAAQRFTTAKRPVILVDDYALRDPDAEAAIASLSEKVDAPVFQLRYRRGPMLFQRIDPRKMPMFAGWLNQFSRRHREVLADADLVITVEDRNMYERVIGPLPNCDYVAITSDPAKARKNGYLKDSDLVLEGHVGATLVNLAERMPARRPSVSSPETETLFKASMESPEVPSEQVRTNRGRLVKALFGAVSQGDRLGVVVDDSQMFGGLIADRYDSLEEGLRVFGDHGGFVGGGLPTALGLASANPENRVFCCLGDQAFTNSFQALAYARQSSAPLSIIICDNGRSVSLTKQGKASLSDVDRSYLDNVHPLSYGEMCAALGLEATTVHFDPREESPDLSTITTWAQADVRCPRVLVLTMPSDPESWLGIWVTSGFESA